jgi:acetyl esterase/lipase
MTTLCWRVPVVLVVTALLVGGLLAQPAAQAAAPPPDLGAGRVARNVTYCTGDGQPLTMDLYFPSQAAAIPMPTVVFVHGGGWEIGEKDTPDEIAPEMIRRGYVVASINYRLAPQSRWPAQIEDVKCAIRYLRAEAGTYHLDAERIGVWGSSAGGHLAALLGLTDSRAGFDGQGGYPDQSSRVQAVVDLYGPADLPALTKTGSDRMVETMQRVFGAGGKMPVELLQQASPVAYVSSAAPPFLILQGDKDTMVPASQSEELYRRLRAAGVPATLVLVRNGDHGFVPAGGPVSPSQAERTRLIADFFDRYLLAPAGTPSSTAALGLPDLWALPVLAQTIREQILDYASAYHGMRAQ